MIRTVSLCFAGLTLFCIPTFATPPASVGQQTLIMEGFAPDSQDGFTVRQARLNDIPVSLSAPEAQATMHQRIETAAHAVCRYNGTIINSTIRKKIASCENKVVHEALAKLHLPETPHL